MLDMNSPYHHVLNRICEEVHQEMAGKLKENGEIDWTVNAEVLFLYAMIGHKPVGVNRHFMMLLIHNKFSAYINHEISSKALWNHLDSMYDMAALHESEIIPFPNDEVEFELPEDCHELLRTKYGVSLKKSSGESETNKNSSSSSKSSKKLTPKFKLGATVNTPKNIFTSPILSKPLKSQNSPKIEVKTPTSDATSKSKELGLSAKINKVKRSSSPLAHRPIKSDTSTKEGSPDVSSNKKSSKSERGNSPAILKKPIKTESAATNSSSKKVTKSESGLNVSKTVKSDTLDTSAKKDKKADKDVKKGKIASSSDSLTKKPKVDTSISKKKTESESSSRKSSESSSVKSLKGDVKHTSHSSRDAETPTSGSRKSSPVVKVKGGESSKKLKRPKVEEPSKKMTPGPKRRRL